MKGKISFHTTPAHLTTCIASSIDHCPLLEWYLLQLMNFHGCIIQSAQFTLGFTLGVVPPLRCAEPLGHVQLFSVPWAVSPPGSSVHGDSPGNNARAGCHVPPLGDLPNPGVKPRSPALQADYLPAELPGKPCTSYQLRQIYNDPSLCYHTKFVYSLKKILCAPHIHSLLPPTLSNASSFYFLHSFIISRM